MALEIFAGPLVRRADETVVTIWIAMRFYAEVHARVYQAATNGGKLLGSAMSTSIELNGLFIHLTEVRPVSGTFPRGEVLEYSIAVPGAEETDDTEFRAWALAKGLTYPGGPSSPDRPSFILQPRGGTLQIAAGSCRKPHDPGVDALSKVDDALAASHTKPQERLQILLLTGDQIYADDVDRQMVLPAVTKLSQQMGLVEILPGGATHTISYLNRKDVAKRAGFKSDEAEGHLLSLGEYIAMYGLVWNPDNWHGHKIGGDVLKFVLSLAKVRRLLANISTYMIFDDHDVTDDWFIHNDHKREVLSRPIGKRVVANALAAYWLMQGWGNAPSRFDAKKAKQVIEARVANPSDLTAAKEFEDFFLSIGERWEYATPTDPICYALDTRTQRGGAGFPPILKSSDAWRNSNIIVQNKNMPFVLIAPCPLFTSATIDVLQSFYSSSSDKRKFEVDVENWLVNSASLLGLIDKLQSLHVKKVVVLSGDVHYGYSAVFRIHDNSSMIGSSGYIIDGVQITGSALKNGGLTRPKEFIVAPSNYYLLVWKGKTEIEFIGSDHLLFEKNRLFHKVLNNDQLSYVPFQEKHYPDFLVVVKIGYGSPETAPLLRDHNYTRISIMRNDFSYRFNEGKVYHHSL